MDESNSQPTRCPCGFFGSQQTLGLCSKCFREREQNCNQPSSDVPRSVTNDLARQVIASTASSTTDGSRQSGICINGEKSSLSNPVDQQSLNVYHCQQTTSQSLQSSTNGSSASTALSLSVSKISPDLDSEIKASASTCSCNNESSAEKRLILKRKHKDAVECADGSPTKRRRTANPDSHCHMCDCRLELAIQAMGKCKCGCVFCQLHRLPEQHNCSYDHKEDGRREARAKMVPARKHVGTTLKRLDSDS